MTPKKVKYILVLTLLCLASISAQDQTDDYFDTEVDDGVVQDVVDDTENVGVVDVEENTTNNEQEVVEDVHSGDTLSGPEDLTPEVIPVSYPNESIPMSRSGKLLDGEYGGNYEDGLFGSDNNNYDSLKSRYAPTEPPSHRAAGTTGGGFILSETRLREIRSQFLYWFFDKGGSNDIGDYQKDIHTSTPQIHKNFNFQLPFFGFRFNYTRLSMHGYLEFSDPPEHYTYPLTFPIKDWPRRNDPSFIGIFFSKCRIGAIRPTDVDQRSAGVYWRQERDLMTRTDQFGVEVRERVMWDIRQGVVGSDTFIPKHAVFITWKNMSFAGGIDNSLFKTNTFQLVLATDEVYTYAIFNYADLQWSAHTEAGGDTTGGEGGVPAYIGFNAGNGTRSYEYKPYSQESVLRDLTGRGWANGFPGRHIFRIDETIMLGTCNKDIDSAHLPLVFAPESGNMLGGTVVNITGPCFDTNERVSCRFDTEEVVATVIDRNRAICVQPFLMAQGYIRFEIRIGTEKYKWKGRYFVETPATATDRVFFQTRDVHEQTPSEIKITWNRFNLTSNLNAGVQISLWGYRERTIRPQLEYIDMIEASITNTGEYIIAPNNYRQRENTLTNDMQFGFIQINLTNPEQFSGLRISPILWSKPIPLGWYFGPQWERRFGNQWPRQLCDTWLKTDRYLRNFAAEIPICPCTLEQALNDKGRFLPDFECDRDSNPTCLYHRGALHCVRSGHPSQEGAEQQCCYGRNGFLMMSYDQQWGSRPRRSHNLGLLPWDEANKVPTLSTWFHDMIPFYSCCWWQDEQAVGCETFRFERRPTQDCIAYQAPGIAAVFGDPHIITFDNLHYTFNGMGEFVLVRGNTGREKLEIQGRFERVANNIHGQVHATHLTSVAASGNNSVTIEVRVRPRHAQWRYRLDVFAGGRRIYFDRPSLKFQHFEGVTVYTPSYILNQSEVIVMFASGAGLEVVENQGFMTARVYLPWTFINKTRGLMGNWSWDPADDFIRPDGTPVSVGNINNFQSIHNDFALHWMLSDRAEDGVGAALFTREFGRTASYYANRTFVPNFIREPVDFLPPNRTQDIIRASDLCGESYQCRYDYGMTLNRDMAHFTKNYYDSAVNIRTVNERRVISCGILETPRFGRKSSFLFTPGTRVTFECNQGFVLIGDQRRVCTDGGRWDTPEFGYTECLREVFYTARMAWITTGIILAVIVPILFMIGVCIYVFIKKSKSKPEPFIFIPRSRSSSRADLKHSMASLNPKADAQDFDLDSGFSHPGGDSGGSGSLKKRRTYDESYRTQEPLKNRPDVEFPEKKWDLTEDDITSDITSGSSEYNKDTLSKPSKEFQYLGSDAPKQLGRSRQKLQSQDYEFPPLPEIPPEENNRDSFLPPPPATSPPGSVTPSERYSPTYSPIERTPVSPVYTTPIIAQNSKQFSPPFYTQANKPRVPPPITDPALPRSNSRSTEV